MNNEAEFKGVLMRKFNNIASLIKRKRLAHPKGLSQSDLSHLLGYKNGQFISNVERALCNIPFKMMNKVCDILQIAPAEIRQAMLNDYEDTINAYLASNSGLETTQTETTEVASPLTGGFSNNTGFGTTTEPTQQETSF